MNRDIYVLNNRIIDGVINLPVMEIVFYKESVVLDEYDFLIFTSQNAVLAIDEVNYLWKSIKCLSIGEKTSQLIKDMGGIVFFTSSYSRADKFSYEIKKILKGFNALFIRAKRVNYPLKEMLSKSNIYVDEKILYESRCSCCSKLSAPRENSVIIFSSPYVVECFFKCFNWMDSYDAVVIGEKTAKHMPSNINYVVSPKKDINFCIDIAKRV